MTGRTIVGCNLPKPAPANDQEVYRRIRDKLIRMHCSAKREHQCCGKITIDRDHITFQCALCGDARQLIEDKKRAPQGRSVSKD